MSSLMNTILQDIYGMRALYQPTTRQTVAQLKNTFLGTCGSINEEILLSVPNIIKLPQETFNQNDNTYDYFIKQDVMGFPNKYKYYLEDGRLFKNLTVKEILEIQDQTIKPQFDRTKEYSWKEERNGDFLIEGFNNEIYIQTSGLTNSLEPRRFIIAGNLSQKEVEDLQIRLDQFKTRYVQEQMQKVQTHKYKR